MLFELNQDFSVVEKETKLNKNIFNFFQSTEQRNKHALYDLILLSRNNV